MVVIVRQKGVPGDHVKHNSPSIEGLIQEAISDWGIMGTQLVFSFLVIY
jgi:hypothetical protein